jgi:hypothetical protein
MPLTTPTSEPFTIQEHTRPFGPSIPVLVQANRWFGLGTTLSITAPALLEPRMHPVVDATTRPQISTNGSERRDNLKKYRQIGTRLDALIGPTSRAIASPELVFRDARDAPNGRFDNQGL